MCYTSYENDNSSLWQIWYTFLEDFHLRDFSVFCLEEMGGFLVIIQQFLYIAQPILCQVLPDAHCRALLQVFEDPNQTKELASYLRHEEQC